MDELQQPIERCGLVAIVGRPNVGKSTYLNSVLGQKLSITSRKPQTTRYRLLGVKTIGSTQLVFIDTPGLQLRPGNALRRTMNEEVHRALQDVDAVVLLVEALRFTDEDKNVVRQLRAITSPLLVAVNKTDTVEDKRLLLPFLQQVQDATGASSIVPVSALTGDNLPVMERTLIDWVPAGPALFPNDQVTDKTERFLVGEILREKLMRSLGAEVPYSVGVVIEDFDVGDGLVSISAVVWVERESQKPIVIGNHGKRLKEIGTQARRDMERLLEQRVFLKTWVKVKDGWANNHLALRELDFDV